LIACSFFVKFVLYLPQFRRGVEIADDTWIIEELIETAAN
jgi:hypothetical protein